MGIGDFDWTAWGTELNAAIAEWQRLADRAAALNARGLAPDALRERETLVPLLEPAVERVLEIAKRGTSPEKFAELEASVRESLERLRASEAIIRDE